MILVTTIAVRLRADVVTAGLVMLLALTACGSPATTGGSTAPPQPSAAAAPQASPGPATANGAAGEIVGTVVRFSSGAESVDVTVGQDNPAARSLLSMLPMTLRFEDLSGREKIAYPPQRLRYDGSPGSDPENGDLIYFTPWGNLGFYYNADGIDYSDQTIHLGRYTATPEQLDRLTTGEVTISAVR